MVAVLLYAVYVVDTDLGFGKETVAHACRVQHYLGMDFVYGSSTAPSLIELFRQQLG
jgi:hypothetical protein